MGSQVQSSPGYLQNWQSSPRKKRSKLPWRKGLKGLAALLLVLAGGMVLDASVRAEVVRIGQWLGAAGNQLVIIIKNEPPPPPVVREFPYYFQLNPSAGGYQVLIYRVGVPVPLKNEQALLELNGPVADSDLLGGLSQVVLGEGSPPLGAAQLGGEPLELAPGVMGALRDKGTAVSWRQGGWNFEYVGPAGKDQKPTALLYLQTLAAFWPEGSIGLINGGQVKIVMGKKLLTFVTWDYEGVRYSLQTGSNVEELIGMLDAAGEWAKLSQSK